MKFSELIKNEIPFYFENWGDGEFYTIKLRQEEQYQNCDGDKYTKKFSTDLLKALDEIEKDSENHYIGRWLYHKEVYDFFNQYKFNFVNFHRFMFYEGDYEEKIEIFRNIKNSKLKKVYVCNEDLVEKLRPLLNIDEFLIIPKKNWYDEKGEEVFEKFNQRFSDIDLNLVFSRIDYLIGLVDKNISLNIIAMSAIFELSSLTSSQR